MFSYSADGTTALASSYDSGGNLLKTTTIKVPASMSTSLRRALATHFARPADFTSSITNTLVVVGAATAVAGLAVGSVPLAVIGSFTFLVGNASALNGLVVNPSIASFINSVSDVISPPAGASELSYDVPAQSEAYPSPNQVLDYVGSPETVPSPIPNVLEGCGSTSSSWRRNPEKYRRTAPSVTTICPYRDVFVDRSRASMCRSRLLRRDVHNFALHE